MLFNSIVFILAFMPVTTIVYYRLRVRWGYEPALLFLTVASVFFYAYWDVFQTWRIFASMIGNFAVGNWLQRLPVGSPSRKYLLGVGVSLNVAALLYFKYTLFIAANINLVFGTNFQLEAILLPLGISFFTFNEIAYLVDSYKGKTREYKFTHYCLFVTYFPHLIAGPIIHHKQLMGEFARQRKFRQSDISVGLTIFLIGLGKKVLIADNIAIYSTPVFDGALNGATPSFFEAWAAAFGFTFQLYFDFSGYSDMAVGLSRLFGIQLPINFYSPYKSASIIEFWRRWHISLSKFLRDYIYIPLGGGHRNRYLNLMATMLIGGLWHGANWTFLIWGGLHGFYLVLNHLWIKLSEKIGLIHHLRSAIWWKTAAIAFTFLSVVIGWVFFRSANVDVALSIVKSMVGVNGLDLPQRAAIYLEGIYPALLDGGYVRFSGMFPNDFSAWQTEGVYWLLLGGLICFLCPSTTEFMRRYRPGSSIYPLTPNFCSWSKWAWRANSFWGALAGLTGSVLLLTLFSANRSSEFLYFQF